MTRIDFDLSKLLKAPQEPLWAPKIALENCHFGKLLMCVGGGLELGTGTQPWEESPGFLVMWIIPFSWQLILLCGFKPTSLEEPKGQ